MPGRTRIVGGSCEVDSLVNDVEIHYHHVDGSFYFTFTIKKADGTFQGYYGELEPGAEVTLEWDEDESALFRPSGISKVILT